jgi:5'-methylthioadenosine phosphorylase
VLAISSVGGLRPELSVGTVLVPHDFIALDTRIAVHEDRRGHIVPAFNAPWRARVVAAVTQAVAGMRDEGVRDEGVRDGGVYWQTNGPRFETPAEIRFIAAYADVVGMTAASEAIVAQELDIAYAVVSIVDNLANGVAATPLTNEEFESGKKANRELVIAMLDAIVPVLAE